MMGESGSGSPPSSNWRFFMSSFVTVVFPFYTTLGEKRPEFCLWSYIMSLLQAEAGLVELWFVPVIICRPDVLDCSIVWDELRRSRFSIVMTWAAAYSPIWILRSFAWWSGGISLPSAFLAGGRITGMFSKLLWMSCEIYSSFSFDSQADSSPVVCILPRPETECWLWLDGAGIIASSSISISSLNARFSFNLILLFSCPLADLMISGRSVFRSSSSSCELH